MMWVVMLLDTFGRSDPSEGRGVVGGWLGLDATETAFLGKKHGIFRQVAVYNQ